MQKCWYSYRALRPWHHVLVAETVPSIYLLGSQVMHALNYFRGWIVFPITGKDARHIDHEEPNDRVVFLIYVGPCQINHKINSFINNDPLGTTAFCRYLIHLDFALLTTNYLLLCNEMRENFIFAVYDPKLGRILKDKNLTKKKTR